MPVWTSIRQRFASGTIDAPWACSVEWRKDSLTREMSPWMAIRVGDEQSCGLHISALRCALLDEDGAEFTPLVVHCNIR